MESPLLLPSSRISTHAPLSWVNGGMRKFLSSLVFRVRSISSRSTILSVIGIRLKPRDQSLTNVLMGLQQMAGAIWCTNLHQRRIMMQVSTIASNNNIYYGLTWGTPFPPFLLSSKPGFEPQVLRAARILPKIWQLISDYCNTSPRKTLISGEHYLVTFSSRPPLFMHHVMLCYWCITMIAS